MLLKTLGILLITLQTSWALDLERFKVPKNFSASFTQERFIKSTDMTLNSSGEVQIKQGTKLFWNQLKPFSHQIIMTKDSILSGEEGDLKPVKEPMAKYMAKIMFNLFNGSLDELKNLFEISESHDYILLRPKDKTMSKFIKQIRVEGKSNIEKIKLSEKSGNFLSILFLAQKY